MFDQILEAVKEHFAGNPAISSAIPAEQSDEVHREVATQINNGLQQHAPAEGGISGLLSKFESGIGSGNMATSAISGGLVGSLGSKFGLSPAITGAIAAALPGLLQKFAQRSGSQQTGGAQSGGLSSFL